MLADPVGPEDHVRGDPSAPVILLAYIDFESPECAQAQPILRELLRQLHGTVQLALRHFPMIEIHPHAFLAAQAAEGAGAQGRFAQMHDLLFATQGALELEDLIGAAAVLELDIDQFGRELVAGTHADRVKADMRSGMRSGVTAAPTCFINGVRFDGSWTLDKLRLVVIAARARARFWP